MSTTINGTSGVTFSDGTNQTTSPFTGGLGFRNRIINGDFRIDQRNAGASVTPANGGTYSVDRWIAVLFQSSKLTFQQNAGAVTPPAGFSKYLGITVASAYTPLTGEYFKAEQRIEGYTVSDLAWGTASAQAITVSFWARSSLTGTFSGAVTVGATTQSYVFTYTITAANTWQYVTVSIPGNTTTAPASSTNSFGLALIFNLGTGSTFETSTTGSWVTGEYYGTSSTVDLVANAGASFYITGVQLEKGSTATSFDYRPYGTELALCQRYCQKTYDIGTALGTSTNIGTISLSYNSVFGGAPAFRFIAEMRAAPTMTGYATNGTSGQWSIMGGATNTVTFGDIGTKGCRYVLVTSGGTTGYEGHYLASAEL